MKVVLAGATGFIGQALIRRLLENGDEVILLSRSPERAAAGWEGRVKVFAWDGVNGGAWEHCLDGADGIVNLCGEPIAGKRWTPEQKKKIVKSRTLSTRAVVRAAEAARQRPKVLVNASGIGYYGSPPGDSLISESSPAGKGFLAETCEAWESEALAAEGFGIRVALARIGIVLEKDGGALQKMLPPFLLFAGGPLGSGKQGFPWVHREDVVEMLLFALREPRVSGPFNACAPQSVTMEEFSRTLGRVLGRPAFFRVPGFMLRLLLGEMAELLLGGQRAVPARLQSQGYAFHFPELENALRDILCRPEPSKV